MVKGFVLKGWAEVGGERLSSEDLESALSNDPGLASRLGGEFFITWEGCMARDHFGIMPGDCPPGEVVCGGRSLGSVDPDSASSGLAQAIETAVRLRSDEGVVALSGGVDSALVAHLAGRECISVGVEGSHDLARSGEVARELGLDLVWVVLERGMIEDALVRVLKVIPRVDPVDASIATTLYFVAERASEIGHSRILAGQGADELFGGYARYLKADDLARDLERDFLGLKMQLARDQAVAAIHGTYFSLPYMDVRVVSAARAIPPEEKVCGGVRKRPLRDVASLYLPQPIAGYEKKAMQYGSGVMKEISRLARLRGYKRSIQGYLDQLAGLD